MAKGGYTDEYDYYGDDYSGYYTTGKPAWTGDSSSGWHKPSIVASSAIMIQSGNKAVNARKPQIQFHQYGYGGMGIEYDGPNKKLVIGENGTSNANRFNSFVIRMDNANVFTVINGNGVFTGTSRATDFIGTSDITLKENVKELEINKIKSVYKSFNFIEDKSKRPRIGVIAQELEEVHPEFITTDEDGIKAVSYIDLHSAEIAYLKAENKELKEKMEMIISKLDL